MVCCEDMENNIKHHKSEDHSDRRLGKKTREREVLNWFRREGYRRQVARTVRKIRYEGTEKYQTEESCSRLAWDKKTIIQHVAVNNHKTV